MDTDFGLIGWLVAAAIGGGSFGMVCRYAALGAVNVMTKMERDSKRLAHLRSRTRRQEFGIAEFNDRSGGLRSRIKDAKMRHDAALEIRKVAAKEVAEALHRPEPVWRMVGDERAGAKCYAAHIVNRDIAKRDARMGGSAWLPRDWRLGVLAVAWGDGRGEVRTKFEGTFPHNEGFAIGPVFEFHGALNGDGA